MSVYKGQRDWAELKRKSIELSKQGLSPRQISERLGVSESSIRNWNGYGKKEQK